MTIPEKILKEAIEYLLTKTIDDYEKADEKEQTFLYRVFGGEKLGGYDYFSNAVSLLTRTNDHPRHVEVHLFFNRERFALPTMHISLPSETSTVDNGIGFDTDYDNTFFDPELPLVETKTRTFSAQYNVVFTSDSTFEVLIMFYWLKACFVGCVDILELNGLQNIVLSAQDIMLNEGIAPPNVFSRALGVQCQYNLTAPNMNAPISATSVDFEATPKNPE